jgi:hypothetical protein
MQIAAFSLMVTTLAALAWGGVELRSAPQDGRPTIEEPQYAMGGIPPLGNPDGKPPKDGQIVMKRYIVTHNCPELDASEIAQSMAGFSYKIVREMQFTPQFIVEASDEAIAALRKNHCVKVIQADTPVGPAGG